MTALTIKPADVRGEELHKLVSEQLQRHNLRLRPGQTVGTVIADLQAQGLSLEPKFGTLTGKVGDVVADIPSCLETFAGKNAEKFYPRDVATGIKSRDAMDRRGKAEFISKHGLAAFEALPATVADVPAAELDPAVMTRAQYVRLPLKIKSECAGVWGADSIARIMARK